MRRAGEERRRATSPLAVQTYKYRTEELLMYPFPDEPPRTPPSRLPPAPSLAGVRGDRRASTSSVRSVEKQARCQDIGPIHTRTRTRTHTQQRGNAQARK